VPGPAEGAGAVVTGPYTCWGPVRGYCGIYHATLAEAEAHMAEDGEACQQQCGGYSDRGVLAEDPHCPGRSVWAWDGAIAWPSHGRGCGSVQWPQYDRRGARREVQS
jgi:hypothetical protein